MKLSARIWTITHLCLALWFVVWALMQPWTGEYFSRRSLGRLYDYVMLDPRFEDLPSLERGAIEGSAERFGAWEGLGLGAQLAAGADLLLLRSSPYVRMWAFCSVVLCFLLLFQVRGGRQAVWILPLITLLFALDNIFYGTSRSDPDSDLFPTEDYLIEHYLEEPWSSQVSTQRRQLEAALQNFFAAEWSPTGSASEGAYRFQVQRLHRWRALPLAELTPVPKGRDRQSPAWLIAYLVWNIAFAIAITRLERPHQGDEKVGYA